MPSSSPLLAADAIESPAMRQAGAGLLSLALMDARNHTLQLLTLHEQAAAQDADETLLSPATEAEDLFPIPDAQPLWLAGYAGWFAERWIGRNTQRNLGPACPVQPMRLASIQPQADSWWNPRLQTQDGAATTELPDTEATRAYLLETLESTLELLDKAAPGDAALYFYRLALQHEDLCGEALVVQAQAQGVPLTIDLPAAIPPAEAVMLPSAPWTLGLGHAAGGSGFAFDIEQGHQQTLVPEFEIDAHPVSWAQYVEFVADGGYDREALWHPTGWAWLQGADGGQARRAPRYVDRIGAANGAVMLTRFGKPMRMAGQQLAMHLSWWEADAWCRWAGRRLPSEAEWEMAALHGARQGFRWGDVHEWVANTLHPWEGFLPGPWSRYASPFVGRARVLRGASFATRRRMKHPRFRGFALPAWDAGFVGFRSCSI